MDLSPSQRQMLVAYRKYHARPMNLTAYRAAVISGSSYRIYGSIIIAALLLLLVKTPLGGPWVYVTMGALIGIGIHQFWGYWQFPKQWALLNQIIDWEKVETLLSEPAALLSDSSDKNTSL